MSLENQLRELLATNAPYLSKDKPSDWAERHRVMTSDVSPFPGKFSYERTPYLREPVDCLSPDHPARVVAVMKGAQIGFSTGVIENGIGYIISEQPGNVLLAARDDALVKVMMDSKIDQMIDSCGLRKLIKPNVLRKKNSRTGDTSFSKEFPGGSLRAFSIQKPGRMRQISCMYGFLDDFEAAPHSDKDAGSSSDLFESRFAAYYDKMKLFYISTPEVRQDSNIEPLFLKGDQRKYMCPCPKCGSLIPWEWSLEVKGERAGIVYKTDNHGALVPNSVVYVCQDCGGSFDDRKKRTMLLDGEWRPTARPSADDFFSYQISALYAPPGMYNWEHYVRKYLEAVPVNGELDKEKYKTFRNTVLGLTWEEYTSKPEAKGIALNTRDYDSGIVPDEISEEDGNGKIILVTLSCDLNGTKEDARLDWEIVAWSESGASYSIDHGSIGTFVPRENQRNSRRTQDREKWSYHHGDSRSVWPKLSELLGTPIKTQRGDQMGITIAGIDTGHYTTEAYAFIDSWTNKKTMVIGLKGKDADVMRRENADSPLFKRSKERTNLFLVEVNKIKDDLSNLMLLKWNEQSEQPRGFMNFPHPGKGKYTFSEYFMHYEAEERQIRRSRGANQSSFQWVKRKSTAPNHFWDIRVYGICLKEIVSYLICKDAKLPPSWDNYAQLVLG